MLKISAFPWVALAGSFACFVLTSAAGIREDIAVVRICNATDPVNIDVFNDYMMHHDFVHLGRHTRELSCFLLCIYNEYKWMNRYGSFRLNKIKSWLRRSNLGRSDQELLVHKCVTTAGLSDPCARARLFTECFWLNHQVKDADGKLGMITWRIDAFEKEFQDPNEVSVPRLLRSMTQVKEECQTLHQDILEVQQLQKQLSDSLRAQLTQVHSNFNILRNRILGQKKLPQLK